jgi:N12 class adenine-specific DNA methylase
MSVKKIFGYDESDFSGYDFSALAPESRELANAFLAATENVDEGTFKREYDALEAALLPDDATDAQWAEYDRVIEALYL